MMVLNLMECACGENMVCIGCIGWEGLGCCCYLFDYNVYLHVL